MNWWNKSRSRVLADIKPDLLVDKELSPGVDAHTPLVPTPRPLSGRWRSRDRHRATVAVLTVGLVSGMTIVSTSFGSQAPIAQAAVNCSSQVVFVTENGGPSLQGQISTWGSKNNGTFYPDEVTTQVNEVGYVSGGFGRELNTSTLFADVNSDQIGDVVVATEGQWLNGTSRTIAVYLGNADGSYASVPVENTPAEISDMFGGSVIGTEETLIGDVNNDGRLDIVWAYDGSGGAQAYAWINDGSVAGGFYPNAPVATSGLTLSGDPEVFGTDVLVTTLMGDVDGANGDDIIYVAEGLSPITVKVWLSNGDGTFNPNEVSSSITTQLLGLGAGTDVGQVNLVGDLNDDGKDDLFWSFDTVLQPDATQDTSDRLPVYVWPATTGGSFNATSTTTNVLAEPWIFGTDIFQQTMLADVTSDGMIDIVFAHEVVAPNNEVTITVYQGNGDFTFDAEPQRSAVTPSNGAGTFGRFTDQATGVVDVCNPWTNIDASGNTVPDAPVCTTNIAVATEYAYRGAIDSFEFNPTGTLDPTRRSIAPQPTIDSFGDSAIEKTLFGDVNGDDIDDVLYAFEVGGLDKSPVRVFLGTATGTYLPMPVETYLDELPYAMGDDIDEATMLGDLNGDGRADLLWVEDLLNNTAYVWFGNADGTFATTPVTSVVNRVGLALSGFTGVDIYRSIGLADADNDNDLDMVAAVEQAFPTGATSVWLNNGDGTFATNAITGTITYPITYPIGQFEDQTTMFGDVTGDGNADIVSASDWASIASQPTIHVWVGTGLGLFTAVSINSPLTGTNYVDLGTDAIEHTMLGDVTGDGELDIVYAYDSLRATSPAGPGVKVWAGNTGLANATFVAASIDSVVADNAWPFGTATLEATGLVRNCGTAPALLGGITPDTSCAAGTGPAKVFAAKTDALAPYYNRVAQLKANGEWDSTTQVEMSPDLPAIANDADTVFSTPGYNYTTLNNLSSFEARGTSISLPTNLTTTPVEVPLTGPGTAWGADGEGDQGLIFDADPIIWGSAVDPTTGDLWAYENTGVYQGRLYRSGDGGSTWHGPFYFNGGFTQETMFVNDIAFTSDGRMLFIGATDTAYDGWRLRTYLIDVMPGDLGAPTGTLLDPVKLELVEDSTAYVGHRDIDYYPSGIAVRDDDTIWVSFSDGGYHALNWGSLLVEYNRVGTGAAVKYEADIIWPVQPVAANPTPGPYADPNPTADFAPFYENGIMDLSSCRGFVIDERDVQPVCANVWYSRLDYATAAGGTDLDVGIGPLNTANASNMFDDQEIRDRFFYDNNGTPLTAVDDTYSGYYYAYGLAVGNADNSYGPLEGNQTGVDSVWAVPLLDVAAPIKQFPQGAAVSDELQTGKGAGILVTGAATNPKDNTLWAGYVDLGGLYIRRREPSDPSDLDSSDQWTPSLLSPVAHVGVLSAGWETGQLLVRDFVFTRDGDLLVMGYKLNGALTAADLTIYLVHQDDVLTPTSPYLAPVTPVAHTTMPIKKANGAGLADFYYEGFAVDADGQHVYLAAYPQNFERDAPVLAVERLQARRRWRPEW